MIASLADSADSAGPVAAGEEPRSAGSSSSAAAFVARWLRRCTRNVTQLARECTSRIGQKERARELAAARRRARPEDSEGEAARRRTRRSGAGGGVAAAAGAAAVFPSSVSSLLLLLLLLLLLPPRGPGESAAAAAAVGEKRGKQDPAVRVESVGRDECCRQPRELAPFGLAVAHALNKGDGARAAAAAPTAVARREEGQPPTRSGAA
jgi:hypothetical protein